MGDDGIEATIPHNINLPGRPVILGCIRQIHGKPLYSDARPFSAITRL
jgi:hypothetical protein